MKDYGKIPSSLWSDPMFLGMPDDPRMLLLYLMTCTHSTIAGVFRLPEGYASEDLNWPASRVAKAFAELLRNGFVKRCETTKWTWVTRHFQTNTLDNPNQVKSAAKCAQQIPDQCTWKQAFMRDCGQLLGLPVIDQAEPIDNGSETLSESVSVSGTGTGTGTGTGDRPSVSSARPTIPCPYQSIVDRYHEKLPELPRVKLMTDSRQRVMRKFWGWVLSSTKPSGERRATTAEEAMIWIGDYFARAGGNDFLMGRGDRSGTHANWRADFDFLLTEKGMRQVIEKTEAAA